MLTSKGVTAWRRALARVTSGTVPAATGTPPAATGPSQAPVPLPDQVTAELVHALAGLAVALAGT